MGKAARKVKIVRFGDFEAENIWAGPENPLETWNLSSREVIFSSNVSPVRGISDLWCWLRGNATADIYHYFPPDYIDRDSHVRHSTVLPLRLFAFLLKRDFNLQVVYKTTGPVTPQGYSWAHIPDN
jgi:hypothetical protein